MTPSPDEIHEVYEQTVVVRRPTYGIVRGYHELPYICVGDSYEPGHRTTCVRGKVHVSPQFVIRPSHYSASYGEIFGEDNVDTALSGRVFGYFGFPQRPVECKSEHLELSNLDIPVEQVLSESMDELDRLEDITTGVLITPNSRYFQVSVERFIASVLEDEFSV